MGIAECSSSGAREVSKTFIGVKVVKAERMRSELAEQVLGRSLDISKVKECNKLLGGDADGYLVTYPDGYVSWCPRFQFEEANRCADGMPFGHAIEMARLGNKIARAGWNGNGMHLEVQFPDENSKMTHPYLFMTIPDCAEGTRLLPWQPAQVDVFAEDWTIVG